MLHSYERHRSATTTVRAPDHDRGMLPVVESSPWVCAVVDRMQEGSSSKFLHRIVWRHTLFADQDTWTCGVGSRKQPPLHCSQSPGLNTAQVELSKFDVDQAKVEIFFSAHGVPESYVEQAGDPYKEEMEQCIGFIMSELRVHQTIPCST